MSSLFFAECEIEQILRRVAKHRWAQRGLERIRLGLEFRREELLAGEGGYKQSRALGTAFLELGLCCRLLDDWHREAAENILRNADDVTPFLFKQTLDLCLGLDFLNGLDETLRARAYERILLPVAERYMKEHRGGSNIQSTTNLTLLAVGLLTRRPDFIDRAISDPEMGVVSQIANSVYPDGFWYEQSHASYHSGSIERFLKMRWIADRNGLQLGGDEVILKMIDTFPGMALPGGVLPLIGEVCGDGRATLYKDWLELAYTMYEIPWIGWALGRMDREGLWSLLIGREIGKAEAPESCSKRFDSTGLCVLKHGARETYWDGKGSGVTVTFGPHGDWHGHAGKLGIEYRQDDRYLVRDHGNSGGYDHPIHRMWFMTTLAHSTVVLDGRNQSFTWTHDRPELERNESGVSHAHLCREDVSACTVSADFAYPGCTLRRTLFLTATYLLDIMECESVDGAEHTFDWVMHTGGTLQSNLPFAHASLECFNKGVIPSPPGRKFSPGAMAPSSYDYIREVEAFETPDCWNVDVMDCYWAADTWKVTGKAVGLSMLGEEGTTVFKGVCPAAARDVYAPIILVRRRACRTTFIALHVPGERTLTLECPVNEKGTIVCRVSGDGVAQDILVKQDEGKTIEWDGKTFSSTLDFTT